MSYFSIKMRASLSGKHISGSERIVKEEDVRNVIDQLLKRPKIFDFMNIKIQKVESIDYIKKSLDIMSITFSDFEKANEFAADLINKSTGIDKGKIEEYIRMIHTGASPDGEVMRGAMVVNRKGERIEMDKFRGVRTTNVDYRDRERIKSILLGKGYTERTLDALAIATKNLNCEYILAEYCISDDPNYIHGYVATYGRYIRLYPLKDRGNTKGGRIYFVDDDVNLVKLYHYLENNTILIEDLGEIV